MSMTKRFENALTLSSRTIPYSKEAREVTGSVTSAILWQQLEYRFSTNKNGFYKFIEPCQHKKYRTGDSWTEELGFSRDEFRSAFDRIGVRHNGVSVFKKLDKEGKAFFNGETEVMYCSVYDKKSNLTYYFRNSKAVSKNIDKMLKQNEETTQNWNPELPEDLIPTEGSPVVENTGVSDDLGDTHRDISPVTPRKSPDAFNTENTLQNYINSFLFFLPNKSLLELSSSITHTHTRESIHELMRVHEEARRFFDMRDCDLKKIIWLNIPADPTTNRKSFKLPVVDKTVIENSSYEQLMWLYRILGPIRSYPNSLSCFKDYEAFVDDHYIRVKDEHESKTMKKLDFDPTEDDIFGT